MLVNFFYVKQNICSLVVLVRTDDAVSGNKIYQMVHCFRRLPVYTREVNIPGPVH